MTPSPTSEPELEAKPVPITDPPKTSAEAASDSDPVTETSTDDSTATAADATAGEPTAAVPVKAEPAKDEAAASEPAVPNGAVQPEATGTKPEDDAAVTTSTPVIKDDAVTTSTPVIKDADAATTTPAAAKDDAATAKNDDTVSKDDAAVTKPVPVAATTATPAEKRTAAKTATAAKTTAPAKTAAPAKPATAAKTATATTTAPAAKTAAATPADAPTSATTSSVTGAPAKTAAAATETPAAKTAAPAKPFTWQTAAAKPAGTQPGAVAAEPVNGQPAAAQPTATEVLLVNEDDEDVDGDDVGYRLPPPAPGTGFSTLVPLAGALVALTALVAVLIAVFTFPAVHSGPNHLPIGVSGTPAITKQLQQLFSSNAPKAFDVHVYTQEATLRKAIQDRKVYGGLSVNGNSATMLVSTAASPIAAEELSSIATSLSSQSQIAVSDVVPLPRKDSRGFGLAALGLPLAIGSLLPALLMFELYRRRASSQLGASLAASVLIGFAVSALLTFWVGSTHGANFWLLGLGLSAGVATASLILLGLGAIGGRIGLAVGAALMLLISAPLSGFSTAPEWLPSPWGTIGQLLPVGAAGSLLRSTAFFHGHGSLSALLVLAAWAVIGLLLFVLGTVLLQPFNPDLAEYDEAELQPAS